MSDLKNLDYLLPETADLLLEFISSCQFLSDFVLVGGSALALHLRHRKSEDLDFFTFEDQFDRRRIFNYLNCFSTYEILNQSEEQIDCLVNGVKVTFFNAKWSFLTPRRSNDFNISSIENIAAMKVNTLFLRAKYRDYYDLYYIMKESMGIQEIFESSKQIITGINFRLFATALLYLDDITDENITHLEPKEALTKSQIRGFFQQELNQQK